MRTTGRATLLAIAVLSAGLAGCGGGGTSAGGGPSAGASGAATGASGGATGGASGGASAGAPGSGSSGGSGTGTGAGSAASCLVGSWKATGLAGKFNGGGAEGTISGGGGLTMTIAADGKTAINFDPMQPLDFGFSVSGGEVKGKFSYAGKVNGVVNTPSGTSGKWEPTGTTDFKSLTVTVDITSPATVRLADKMSIAEFAGTGATDTGGAVDAQPILKTGTYKCSGNTLELGPPAGAPATGTWTLTKA